MRLLSILSIFFMLPLIVAGVFLQGTFTDEDTGHSFEVYTIDDVKMSHGEVMSTYYENVNASDHLTRRAKLPPFQDMRKGNSAPKLPSFAGWVHCDAFNIIDGVHGGGGCHEG